MPISRDARMDRRRRFLRDTADEGAQSTPNQRRQTRKASSADSPADASATKRTAGYSQDVRRTCSQRLVQLIPVRRRSFAAVVFVSLLVPAMLLAAHYWIYVSGVPWYGHPLAVTLDASHPRSIAAWLSSQLWLMCLGATVLTFQLRRHKLDDYNGEYRLWFWLVLTCLIASIDATTKISDLFGLALDRWSQLNLGWSGPAVVQATLAVLIAMLGLRLCTELKSVPTSLVFWLAGLAAWAGSAALGRDEFKIELSGQFRIWLSSVLWLGGLTAIWLSALAYLRNTYLEAQRRFLSRGRLAASGVPFGQRFREAMPSLPGLRSKSTEPAEEAAAPIPTTSRWGLPAFIKRGSGSAAEAAQVVADSRSQDRAASKPQSTPKAQRNTEANRSANANAAAKADEDSSEPQKRRGLGGFLRRATPAPNDTSTNTDPSKSTAKNTSQSPAGWSSWLRKPKDDGQADEYRKVKRNAKAAGATSSRSDDPSQAQANVTATKRRWIPGFSRAKDSTEKQPQGKPATTTKPKAAGGIFSKISLPKFKLPSLRLPPPEDSSGPASTSERKPRPADTHRPPPNTQPNLHLNSGSGQAPDGDDNSRPMTKAERKRLRRMQQQERRSA